jgi:hypothetical protein
MKRKIIRRKHHKLFMRSTKKVKSFAGTTIAKQAAADITDSKHIKVVKRQIPSNIIKHVESNVGVKFKKRPVFYTYEPTRGHYFRPRKECGGWDGASITGYNIKTGKIKGTIVLLPKSHLKDSRLKDNVLTHELAETLVGQHMIRPNVKRGSTTVNSVEHGFFAMAYEKKHLDKHKMSRRQMTELAKKLFNDRKSWK